MKEITIQYFAMFREKTQKDSELIKTQAETAQDCYLELEQRYGFNFKLGHIRVAINDDFSAMTQEIQSGDSIVFIPPVSGG